MRDLQANRGAAVVARRRWNPQWTFVVVAACALAIDLASKIIVVGTLVNHEPVRLFGGYLYLVHTRNTGAAFSLASGYTVALSVVAIVVAAFVARLASKVRSTGWAIALGLIFGGAVGNLVDRIFRAPGPLRGGVVDFFSLFDPFDPPWPVFNVADSSLVLGVCLAVALELWGIRISGRGDAVKDSAA